MRHSESLDKIAPALVSVAAEVKNSPKTAVNKFLKNKYTPLDELVAELRPLLARHGIAVQQFTIGGNGSVGVETVLLHSSGQYMSAEALIAVEDEKGKSAAQVAGSVVTYLRRYALASALNVASEDDDDGHKPQQAPPAAPAPNPVIAELRDALQALASKAPEDVVREYKVRANQAREAEDIDGLKELLEQVRAWKSETQKYEEKEPTEDIY